MRSGIAGGLRSADQLPGVSLTQDRAAALHRQLIDALLAAGALPTLHDRYGISAEAMSTTIKGWLG